MGRLLRESLAESPIVRFGEYDYFVHPLTDGIPQIDPRLLREVVDEIVAKIDRRVDRIITVEAMGIPIGTALSARIGVPLTVVRKRAYGLPNEISIGQETGYSKGQLFLNGLRPGDRVVIVDDVVSTGGTLIPLVRALRAASATVVDAIVVFEKGGGCSVVERETGLKVQALVRVVVENGKLREDAPLAATRAPAGAARSPSGNGPAQTGLLAPSSIPSGGTQRKPEP
jgi:adenine phosphoribosyltransferase